MRLAWLGAVLVAAEIVALAAASTAWAERVLVADSDPELVSALTTTLAPWRFEIIVAPPPPASTRAAEERAIAGHARFVVWRRGGDIVVYDHERGAAELRDAPAGALDPASAMAAALSVKTLMRLPAPGTGGDEPARPDEPDGPAGPPEPDAPTVPVPADAGPGRFRVQIMLGGRAVSEPGLRGGAAIFVRPQAARAWRLGVAFEIGPGNGVEVASFRGTYRDASVVAMASASWPAGALELEPFVGAGLVATGLSGREGATSREESRTLPLVRAGLAARYRLGDVSLGGAVAADGSFGTPTYTRANGNGVLFEVPAFALTVTAIAAFDFDL